MHGHVHGMQHTMDTALYSGPVQYFYRTKQAQMKDSRIYVCLKRLQVSYQMLHRNLRSNSSRRPPGASSAMTNVGNITAHSTYFIHT
jgi:hypothetical protein